MSNFKKFLKESRELERSMFEKTSELVDRWEPSGLLEGIEKDTERHQLSQLLENQGKRLMQEATRTSTTAGSEEWSDIALPMVRKIFVEQLAKELVHTQAMDMPSGLVFYLDFTLDEDKPTNSPFYDEDESVYGITDEDDVTGGFYGGDRFSYSMNYVDALVASANVTTGNGAATWADVDYSPALEAQITADEIHTLDIPLAQIPGADEEALETFTVSGAGITGVIRKYTTIVGTSVRFYVTGTFATLDAADITVEYTKQPTEENRGDFEQGQTGVGAIPQINMNVTHKQIVAKTRKLKTQMSPEIIQDLNAYHALDAQKEMASMLSSFIEQEEDEEILSMLRKASKPLTRYWSATVGRYTDSNTGATDSSQAAYTLGPNDWYRTLGIRIRDLSNEIHRRTLRGGANWLVCSPKVATILESFNSYTVAPESGGGEFALGVERAGTLDGRIRIYKNPYYPENEILMGFRGEAFLEKGAVYSTFVPLMLTPPIPDPETFDIHQGIMTRNAKLILRNEFYGRIVIKDINTV